MSKLDQSMREYLLNKDPATKSTPLLVQQARAIVKKHLPVITGIDDLEVVKDPLSDDFMNLVEVACSNPADETLFGVTFLNPHCYVPDLAASKDDKEPLVKRSVELKLQIMTDMLGWALIVIDQDDFEKLGSQKKREEYLIGRLAEAKQFGKPKQIGDSTGNDDQ